jgi:hypothetical protein
MDRGPTPMKFCSVCGASYSDHIDFCFADGAVLTSQPSSPEDAPLAGHLGLGFSTFGDAEALPPDPPGLGVDDDPLSPPPSRLGTPAPSGPRAAPNDPLPEAPPPRVIEKPPPIRPRTPAPSAPRAAPAPTPAPPALVDDSDSDADDLPPPPVSSPASNAADDEEEEGGRGLVVIAAGIAAVIVAAIAIGAVVVGLGLRSGDETPPETPADASSSAAPPPRAPQAAKPPTPAVTPPPVAAVEPAAEPPPEALAPDDPTAPSEATPPPAAAPPVDAAAAPSASIDSARTEDPPPAAEVAPAVDAPAPEEPAAAEPVPEVAPAEVAPPEASDATPWGAPPAAGPTMVSVTSEPAGATVFVDGSPRGSTPLSLPLDPRNYTIAVELEGFEKSQRVLSVDGAELPVQFSLQPTARRGKVLVMMVGQDGAPVMIDDVPIGTLPAQASEIKEGRHTFTVETEQGTYQVVREVLFNDSGSCLINLGG